MNIHDKINRLIDKIEAIPAMDFAARARCFQDLRAAIEADRQRTTGSAKERFYAASGEQEQDLIERLRFYCSIAMSGQDWIDVEPFFDAVTAERQLRGEPDYFTYVINGVHREISETLPPDDSYDAGTLEQLYLFAPQPAEINIDYKEQYEQMCERCDVLDLKLAEYSERKTEPETEFEDPLVQVIYEIICGDIKLSQNESWDRYLSRLIADAVKEKVHCPTDVCQADGVLCANDEGDLESGVRTEPLSATRTSRSVNDLKKALNDRKRRFVASHSEVKHLVTYYEALLETRNKRIAQLQSDSKPSISVLYDKKAQCLHVTAVPAGPTRSKVEVLGNREVILRYGLENDLLVGVDISNFRIPEVELYAIRFPGKEVSAAPVFYTESAAQDFIEKSTALAPLDWERPAIIPLTRAPGH